MNALYPSLAVFWTKRYAPPLCIAAIIILLFGDVLVTGGDRVLSQPAADLYFQFIHWYSFGFRELRHGNLALWNPHSFSGAPYFGNFESALLYPPNWLFMFLPFAKAANWIIAFHVFLTSWLTFEWARYNGLRRSSSFMAGILAALGGSYFLHVFPGHLTNLAAMAWTPLTLLCVDRLAAYGNEPISDNLPLSRSLFNRGFLTTLLMGSFAVAMQIFAGHPQTVFRTCVAAGLYALYRLAQMAKRQRRSMGVVHLIAGLPIIFGGGAALSAVQILSGLDVARESTRQGGISYSFAAMLSFSPENFISLLAPTFYGTSNYHSVEYWGRYYFWELTCFVGVTALLLATWHICCGARRRWDFLTLAFALTILALGVYTPLFPLLYRFVPGFNKFRVNAEFIYPASLFIVLLAGCGLDDLWRLSASGNARGDKRLIIFTIATVLLCLCCAAIALWIQYSSARANDGLWSRLMLAFQATKQTYVPLQVYRDPQYIAAAGRHAAQGMATAALFSGVLAAFIIGMRRARWTVVAIGVCAVLEVTWFAYSTRPSFSTLIVHQPEVEQLLKANPGDYRVLNIRQPNAALAQNTSDIWGYDPVQMMRYSRFMAWTQNQRSHQEMYVDFKRNNHLYSMLRCRYIIIPQGENMIDNDRADTRLQIGEAFTPRQLLPHLLLLDKYSIVTGRDEYETRSRLFAAMGRSTFDPRHQVLIESEPTPKPVPGKGAAGSVQLVSSSTDSLEIKAHLSRPAILLITDSYVKGWRGVPLSDSGQREYSVMPANYILRAVPLQKGAHHFQLEYAPHGFLIGRWISCVAWLLYLTVAAGLSVLGLRSARTIGRSGNGDLRVNTTPSPPT